MTERLHENEAKAEELTRNWTSKWKESHKIIEVKEKFVECVQHAGHRLFALRTAL